MTVVLNYPDGIGNFPRAYIRGFYTADDYPIVSLTDHTLELTQVGYDVQVYLVIRPNFYTPSSNVYSLDYLFDASLSQAYYLGSPYLAAFSLVLMADPVDFSWRIKVTGSGSSGTPTRADLPPLEGYWLNHA
jgi:hypothetical protein